MQNDPIHHWESLPEYIAAQQYSLCLGRIFRSLPWWVRWRIVRPMTGAAVAIAGGIAGFHAELAPGERMTTTEREAFRLMTLGGLRASCEGLDSVSRVRHVSRADILVARELIERIEASVRAADAPPDWA